MLYSSVACSYVAPIRRYTIVREAVFEGSNENVFTPGQQQETTKIHKAIVFNRCTAASYGFA